MPTYQCGHIYKINIVRETSIGHFRHEMKGCDWNVTDSFVVQKCDISFLPNLLVDIGTALHQARLLLATLDSVRVRHIE